METNETPDGNQRFKLRTARDQIIDQILNPISLTFPLTDPPVEAKKPVVLHNNIGEVVITSNQSDVNYTLIDEEKVNLGVKQILSENDLTIETIKLTREDYTFSVVAKKNISDLEKQLLQNVTIKVGVDENIPAALKFQYIDYNTKNVVLLTGAQSNAIYQVFELNDTKNLKPLSAPIDSGNGGDLAIETVNFTEDTTLKISVKNKKTSMSGDLKTKPRVLVYPNDALVPFISQAAAYDFDTNAVIEVPNSQLSTNYQIIFKDIDDDTFNKALMLNTSLSPFVVGNGLATTIKLQTAKKLSEDLTVRVLATKVETGITKELTTTLQIRVKPDHTKKLTQLKTPVKVGENTDIRVENPQRGIEYQLRDSANKEIGWRVYYHKDYGIGKARVGFEFAIGEFGTAPVLLNTGALKATTIFNVLATKANTMEKAQIVNTITIVVS